MTDGMSQSQFLQVPVLGLGVMHVGVNHQRHASVSPCAQVLSRGAWLVEPKGGGGLTNLLNSLLSSSLVSR